MGGILHSLRTVRLKGKTPFDLFFKYSLVRDSFAKGNFTSTLSAPWLRHQNLVCFAGNIAKWNKKEGDEIAAGDSIAEIETDKATMDWEAQDEGFVAKILAQEGAKDVSVGSPVIVIVEEEVSKPY